MSSSRSNPNPKSTCDVFMSFCSKDTSQSFASHLHTALNSRAVVFSEEYDDKLRSEEQIPLSVLDAIEGSRISIIIFSTNYADSRWHLQELEKIMECYRTKGQIVVPVFYDVDPSDVGNRKGIFGKLFQRLTQGILKEDWRAMLREASNIPGFTVMVDSRNESEDIKNIVEHVTGLLDRTDLFVAEHPVGVESRVKDVVRLLNCQQSNNVLLLGIWGMGGIGKTTIAKAVYNQVRRNFDAKSFLLNVSEVWEQNNGQVSLQERLLYDVYKTTKIKIDTIESGKMVLKERLQQKRIFLVLDDVNKVDQLSTLCGSRDWFGEGSRIIITTRDESLLKNFGVDFVYEVKVLDENESFELFCRYAFKQASPKEDYVELSRKMVANSKGLPLALRVLGSSLYGKAISEWKSALRQLERKPNESIQEVLKSSYDSLSEEVKKIFLDIACFYVGMDLNHVVHKLHSSKDVAKHRIHELKERSLIGIGEDNELRMHDLLRELGKEIIREESRTNPEPKIYDVFLSFRGEDTRGLFTSHLYTSLQNAGIYTFRDDDDIQRGDQISLSLPQAIRRSRIAIIVLSRNYANSRWCLKELENIMESRRTLGLVVVPVFYGVDPSEVRHQKGEFGDAFEDLITEISVNSEDENNWRVALLEVGGTAGFVVINSKNESEDIKNIVEHVTGLLDRTDLFVAEHPVGVESRVKDVVRLLNCQQSNNVLLLGIWGMGGIGKTTIAKAVYNQVRRNFDAKSFLLNVREVWEQNNGQVSLQERLLYDVYKTTKIKIDTIESGKMVLKERIQQKRIFLVLDDVNKVDQLSTLCGSRDWFGEGSRIIITTRDDDLLRRLKVDYVVYPMKEMDEKESLELFSWHAFKQPSPREGFAEFSRQVVEYSGGLPLALQVIGSFLLTRGIREWESVLEKLKVIPNDEVLAKLRISFDGLKDDKVKEIFLDISFFFIGMDRDDVIKILNDCGLFPVIGTSILIQQSLVTVDNKNRLGMHDLLRDMGREIVREKSPEVAEERSRLWHHKDVLDVLSKDSKSTSVKGLTLKFPTINASTYLKTKAFEKMERLRLLQLAGIQLDGDYKYLSRDLRWLCWHGFPLKYTPTDFHQGNLVAIVLKCSNLERVWKKSQMLKKLKLLNLSHSPNLRQTPDFSNLPNLEKLILKDCPNLSSISHTIGDLSEILLINLKGCTNLSKLPRSIYRLKSLKTLILSGCSKIDKLEEDLEQMKSLTTLVADKTAITKVPFAVVRSKSIAYISLCEFEGFSRDVFPSLVRSWMSPTNSVLSLVQTSATMSSIACLDEQNSCFQDLSSIIKDLQKLDRIWIVCESEIKLNQNLERILITLDTNREELEATPSTSSAFVDYGIQVRTTSSNNLLTSLLIQMGMNCHIISTLTELILQPAMGPDLLPGNNYPNWLAFNGEGSSVSFEVPEVIGRDLKTIMCVVYFSSPDNITSEGLQNVLVINYTKATIQLYKRDGLASLEEEDEWRKVVSDIEPGDKVEFIIILGNGFIVKKTTVYFIYDEPIDEKTKQRPVPDKSLIASGGGENRFGRHSFALPSLTRAFLTSRPFCFGLVGILFWFGCRFDKRRR